jgi:hypothetical protein
MSNASMFTADRLTHLKIVVLSLVCATVVAGIGVASRINEGSAASNSKLETTIIKAAPPLTAAVGTSMVR